MKIRRVKATYLLSVVGVGVLALIYLITASRIALGDFETYRQGAIRFLNGDDFLSKGSYKFGPYVYLPITIILYLPLALLEYKKAYILIIVANTVGAYLCSKKILELYESKFGGIDKYLKFLIYLSVILSPTIGANIINGQPNYWLLLCLLLGYEKTVVKSRPHGGILFAVPAIFKLWPSVIGLWFVFERKLKSLGHFIASGIASILLSIAVVGLGENWTYFRYILSERSWVDKFDGGLDPSFGVVTLLRPISQVFDLSNGTTFTLMSFFLFTLLLSIYLLTRHCRINNSRYDFLIIIVTSAILSLPSIHAYTIFVYVLFIPYFLQEKRKKMVHVNGIALLLSVTVLTPSNIKLMFENTVLFDMSFVEKLFSIFTYFSPPLIGCMCVYIVVTFGCTRLVSSA